MVNRRRHRRKEAFKTNPLVPLDPRRLKSAIDANGWSIQAFARRIGEHSQTLDNLVKGDGEKRCRADRRRAIANELNVQEEWLGGMGVAVPLLNTLPKDLAIRLSPRLQLAIGELYQKASKALHRDLKAPEVVKELRRQGIRPRDDMLEHRLYWYLFMLIHLDYWRTQFTTWRPPEELEALFQPLAQGDLHDRPSLRTETHDQVSLAMVTVLDAVLDPWFRGDAHLDYDRLRWFVGYDRAHPTPGPMYVRYEGQRVSPLRMLLEFSQDTTD